MDPDDSVLLYNVACNFASLGELDEALEYLSQAIDHGTVSTAWMRNDTDLEPLHDHPRYEVLLKQLEDREERARATLAPDVG
jgi:adenylate cyclase